MRLKWCLLLVVVAACPVAAQESPMPNETVDDAIVDRCIETLATKDSLSAMAVLEEAGDDVAQVKACSRVCRKLYGENKDVTGMLMLGRIGVVRALQAANTEGVSAEVQTELKAEAKTLAYNLSANAWPGWQDEGIVINESDSRMGLDMARLNLRLAGELKRNAEVHGHAYWLLGAQLLVAGQNESAAKAFQQSEAKFDEAKNQAGALMATGYRAIAEEPKNPTAVSDLKTARDQLMKIDTEDSRFFADQLRDVHSWLKTRKTQGDAQ